MYFARARAQQRAGHGDGGFLRRFQKPLQNMWTVPFHDKRVIRKLKPPQVIFITLCAIGVAFLCGIWPFNHEDYSRAFHIENNLSNKDEVVVFGEDRFCGDQISYDSLDISGQIHTGTNAVFMYLQDHCSGVPMWWKPNTGNKHSPRPSKENFQHEEAFRRYGKNGTDTFRKALHVVTIKEPLTWLMSICKGTYGIHLDKTPWFGSKLCPQGISAKNGTMRFVHFVTPQILLHAMNASVYTVPTCTMGNRIPRWWRCGTIFMNHGYSERTPSEVIPL